MSEKLFKESGFIFDFSNSDNAYVADKPNYDGLSAVDFIVETSDEYLFIEVKNPDNKKSHPEARKKFLMQMRLDEFPLRMSIKFKDSLLKELAMGKEFLKPIVYILFLEYSDFDAAQKRKLYERISSHIPKFSESHIYKSANNIKFKLHNKENFISIYGFFNITEL